LLPHRKTLGQHLGPERKSEISGGLEAGIWYDRMRATRKKRERAELRQKLLD
jgi:hypothetical protein